VFQSEKARGLQTGLEEARQQTAGQIADAAEQIAHHFQELESQTVQLVMAVVKKVMQDIDPTELVAAQVKKALGRFKGHKRVLVKVHPTRVDLLHDALERIMADSPAANMVEIKPAFHLAQDQLIIESGTGIVDASMSVQMTAIEVALNDELQSTHESESS
jgi:flagellar biosynthesis/type III secretory pathway protein FliH